MIINTDLIACILGGGGVVGAVQWVVNRFDGKRKKDSETLKNLADLTCANAQDRICWLSDQYIARGSITKREKARLMDMYTPYAELGWNKYAHIAIQEVEKLQVKEMDEK